MHAPTPHRQRGFTLLEILLALAVVAIIAFAVFRVYDSAVNTSRIRANLDDLGQIVAGVHQAFANNSSFTSANSQPGGLTGVANQGHVIPSDMNLGDYSATASLINPWNGPLSLATTSASWSFAINETLPATAAGANCITLVEQANGSDNFYNITVNGQEVFTGGATNSNGLYIGGHLDQSLLVAACAASASTNLVFYAQ